MKAQGHLGNLSTPPVNTPDRGPKIRPDAVG
jgi:hypothetical protein